MLTQTYNIDMIPSGVPLALHISQYDVGLTTFVFTPYVSVGTMDFSVVAEAYLEATKPDMRAIVHACTVGNGAITYTVQEQLAAVAGRVYSKLVFKDASGNIVASKAIVWIVEKAGVTDDAVLSDSDLSGVSEVIQASTNFNDAVPTQTVSGEVLTFDDAVEGAPLEDLKLHLVPNQNLNGYDHPWVGGAGKNKLPPISAQSTSNNGLTLRSNGDGTYTVSGTSTASSTLTLYFDSPVTLPTGTLYISLFNTKASATAGFYLIDSSGNNLTDYTWHNSADRTFTNTGITAQVYGIKLYLVNQGSSAVNYTLKPCITTDSFAESFVPYENICPISGYDAVNVVRCGKNLLAGLTWTTGQYTSGTWGTLNTRKTSDYIEIEPNVNYLMQIDQSQTQDLAFINYNYFNASKTWLGDRAANGQASFNGQRSVEFNISDSSAKYVRITVRAFSDAGVVLSDKNINDAKPLLCTKASHSTYPISLSSAGTVYGGTLDVMSGELVVDRIMKEFVGSSDEAWLAITTANIFRHNALDPLVDDSRRLSGTITNECYVSSYNYTNMKEHYPSISFDTTGRLYLAISDEHSTVAQCKAWLAENPLQVCYYLNTPLTYTLTPTEVTTLLGVNTIWMDAEGTIDASYKARLSSYFMALRTMLAPVEASYTATANYAVGDYLIVGTVLYKVTAAITSGETIAEGSNVTATTVMAEIKALQ